MKNKIETITTPGAVVTKQLKLKKMNEADLASQMGVSKKHVEKLISGEVRLTNATAAKLEKVLGLPVDFWMNLEEVYQNKMKGLR